MCAVFKTTVKSLRRTGMIKSSLIIIRTNISLRDILNDTGERMSLEMKKYILQCDFINEQTP